MFLREPWPQRKRLPHFLVLGTQKGGTTSLQKLLEKHPGVYLPPCKEIQYFSLNYEKPSSWYSTHYQDSLWWQKRGDITPFYLFHPRAPERIHALLPKAKLITLLRDPVERALSQYFHARRHGFETLELEQAMAEEGMRLASGNTYSFQKHSYIARSKYIEQLSRYEEKFGTKQMLILKSEDFFRETASTYRQIQKFLGVRFIPLKNTLQKANAGRGETEKVEPRLRIKLREELAETTYMVKKKYGIDWGW